MLFLLTLCQGFPSTFAQNVSTQGKEFWVSFLGNGFKTRYDTWSGAPQFTWLRIQLIISSKRNCNCTVKNPNTGYEQTFQVHANNPYLLDDIPWEQAYMELEEHGQILSKGLYVTADDTISVYCSNIAEVSFDASYILPVPALGDDYIIQTYDQTTNGGAYSSFYTSAFLIVATENGTTVDITPSVNTLDGHNSGIEYSITLQRGETYQVRSTTGNDLSGTRVSARDCKKIAVFNGNNLTMVPDDGNDSDCIFEHSSLFDMMRFIAEKGCDMIITTDHGSTYVEKPVRILGDREVNTNLRYKYGKNLKYNPKEVFEVEDPEKIFLPKANLSTTYVFAGESDFFAYPNNYNYYVGYYRNTFQHGGISMSEMLIPVIGLTAK